MEKQIRQATTFRTDFIIDDPNEPDLKAMEYISSVIRYDPSGNVKYECIYDPQGNEIDKNESTLNSEGKLLEKVMYNEDGEVAERTTYEYDESGRLKFHYLHYVDGSKDTVTYTYNSSNELIGTITTDEEGVIDIVEKYEYSEGNRISEKVFNNEDELIEERSYEYDDQGNVIVSTSWSEEDGHRIKIENDFDDKGKLIASRTYNENGDMIAREEITLDDEGHIKEVIDETSKGTNKLYVTYDSAGNAIGQEEYNQNDELNHKVDRKFNEFNHLIESDVYINRHGEAISQHYIIRIDYEYYE